MSSDQPAQCLFATVFRDNQLIGVTSITERLLGYILAPAARGRVCATKACEALLALAFGATDWTEVRAGVFLGNDPSLQGLAKLVSHETGRSGGQCRALDAELDGMDLAVTCEDWPACPPFA